MTRLTQICTTLNLSSNTRITDEDLKPLVNLTSLNLAGNTRISDEGLKPLVRLTSLKLWDNTRITDKGLKPLVQLTSLDLTETNFDFHSPRVETGARLNTAQMSTVSYGGVDVRAVNRDFNTFAAFYTDTDTYTLEFKCPFDAGGVDGEYCSFARLRAFPDIATLFARNKACEVSVLRDPNLGGTMLQCKLAAACDTFHWNSETWTLECRLPGACCALATLDLTNRALRLYGDEGGWLDVWVRHGFPAKDLRTVIEYLVNARANADGSSDSDEDRPSEF